MSNLDLKQLAASTAALVVLALVWSVIDRTIRWLNSKTHLKRMEFHGDLVEVMVIKAVKSTYQTYVEKLKA